MSVSNIHKTYQITGQYLITESLPRYTCKNGQIVDFSTRVESRKTEVTGGFVSSNRVLSLSGDPIYSYSEVGT